MTTAYDYQEIVTVEPGKRGGKPCVRGLRITVHEVLEYLASGMTIDEIPVDFRHLGFTYGPPPQIVWIRRGNCSTREIERLLRERYDDPGTFYDDEYGAVLALL